MKHATMGLVFVLFATTPTPAEDWPQFRGPDGRGVSASTGLPEKWDSKENVRWTADLPGRGVSSPVVVGGKVYLTANSGMNQTRLHVLCLDAASGRTLWERQFWATGQTLCHPKTCMAAPTPVADGHGVYALFGTADLVALDSDGNVRWLRSLSGEHPKMVNHVGRASSPVLYQDVLIVPQENQGKSFLLGVDRTTGRDRWRADRPPDNNYATPVLARHGDRADLLMVAEHGLTAFDPLTGARHWDYVPEEGKMSPIPSPVVAGDGLILAPGYGRGIFALRAAAGAAAPKREWKSIKLGAATASPLVADGKVYALTGAGVLQCADLADGKVVWDLRVQGPFSASPVLADGKLYLVNEAGTTFVVRATGVEPKILASNELKDTILATPAIAGGAIFLRSDKHLYCVAGNGKTS
jgi:outer membrane protein assembly factor BamB